MVAGCISSHTWRHGILASLLHPCQRQPPVADLWLPLGKVARPYRPHEQWSRVGVGPCVGEEVWVSLREGCDCAARPPHQGLHLHAGILEEAVGLPLHCVSQIHQLGEALRWQSWRQNKFDVQETYGCVVYTVPHHLVAVDLVPVALLEGEGCRLTIYIV